MEKLILPFLILLFEFFAEILSAQDIHFSQIHASPIMLNPALNGIFNGDLRIITNYRNQWKNVTANFNTYAASIDGKLLYLKNRSFINGGININSDKAGDLNYSKTQVNGCLSIAKSLSRYGDNYLCAGIEFGSVSRSADYSKAHTVESEYDPMLSSAGESLQNDISVGASWYYAKKNKFLLYLGASLYHINMPSIGFSQKSEDQEFLYNKVVLTGGAELRSNKQVSILPSILYLDQGPYREVTLGGYVRHRLTKNDDRSKTNFYYGAWFRWYFGQKSTTGVDALVASVRLDYAGFCYAFSYDVNVSSLASSSKAQGGPEVSIIYIIDTGLKGNMHLSSKNKSKKLTCPEF